MTAEQNDSIRRGIIARYIFGSRTPAPEGWQLVYSGALGSLVAGERQRFFEALMHLQDFDDEEHSAATFDFQARTATFQLADGRLLVGLT